MAKLSDLNKLIEEENKPRVAEVKPLPDPKSFFESAYRAPAAFYRGAMRSPADALALSDFMRGRPNQPDLTGVSRAQNLDESLAVASGVPAPNGFPERVAERIGRTSPFATAAGVGVGFAATNPLAALRNEVIGDVISAMSEQESQDLGMGPGGQMLAGIAGGFIAPGSVADNAIDVPTAATRRTARRAILDEWGVPTRRGFGGGPYRHPFSREVSDAATERAQAEAKRLNVSTSGMRRASSEAKRRHSIDPYGNEQFLPAASNRIDEARELFPDPKSRPLTDQILSDEADIAAMGAELDKVDHEFRNAAGGRRKVVRADLEAEFERMLPNGSADGVNLQAAEVLGRANEAEAALWAAIPREQVPVIDLRSAHIEMQAIRNAPKNASGKYLPDDFNELEAMGMSAPFDRVHALYKDLAKLQREAKKSLPGSEIREVAYRARNVTAAIRRALDGIPDDVGGVEFRAARDFTRSKSALFDPESAGYDAILFQSEGPKMARTILSANGSADEARRVVDILGRTETGRDQLARVFVDELFDESLGQKTPRQLLIQLRRNRETYRVVFGDERARFYEGLVRRADLASRRKTGTTAAVDSTGTGRAAIDILFGGAEAVTEPISASKKVLNAIRKSATTDKERSAILREAMYDPELWQTLIQMPEPRAVAAWIQDWDRLVGRARARTGIATRSAIRSAGSERENLSVDSPLPQQGMGGVR